MQIQQTKWTIATPQPIGMLMPQIPTPLMISQPMATVIMPNRLKAIRNPIYQPRHVGRVRTIELILSPPAPTVSPAPITAVSRRISGESTGALPPTPQRRLPILEAQEVTAAHFIGTVIPAIARADAPVVGHVVQTFGAVARGADRTNLLARRVLALLAGNRLEECLRIEERLVVAGGIVSRGLGLLVIAVNADPVHFAAAHHLILADDGNIVF